MRIQKINAPNPTLLPTGRAGESPALRTRFPRLRPLANLAGAVVLSFALLATPLNGGRELMTNEPRERETGSFEKSSRMGVNAPM